MMTTGDATEEIAATYEAEFAIEDGQSTFKVDDLVENSVDGEIFSNIR